MKRKGILFAAGLFGVLAFCTGISGCQTEDFFKSGNIALEVTSVSVTLVALDKSYDNVVAVLSTPAYNDADKAALLLAKGSVDRARADLRAIASGDKAAAVVYITSSKASEVYAELKNAYVQVRGVVLAHRSEFTPADWAYLVALNSTIVQLDHDVMDIWTAKGAFDAKWGAAIQTAALAGANITQLIRDSRH